MQLESWLLTAIHWGLGPGSEGPLFSRLGKGRDDGTLADDLKWLVGRLMCDIMAVYSTILYYILFVYIMYI